MVFNIVTYMLLHRVATVGFGNTRHVCICNRVYLSSARVPTFSDKQIKHRMQFHHVRYTKIMNKGIYYIKLYLPLSQ